MVKINSIFTYLLIATLLLSFYTISASNQENQSSRKLFQATTAEQCKQNDGEYLDGEDGECYNCIKNCKVCVDTKTCQTCYHQLDFIDGECTLDCGIGQYYDEASYSCKGCIDHCDECESQTGCEKCESNYFFQSSECKSCSDLNVGCETCDSVNECADCQEGYYLNDLKQCIPCAGIDSKCTSCYLNQDGEATCTSCSESYFPVENQCLTCPQAITNCQTCQLQQNQEQNQNQEQILTCTKCASSYFLEDEQTCSLCSEYDSNCKKCQEKYYCNLCAEGFIVDTEQDGEALCVECSQKINGCDFCAFDDGESEIYFEDGEENQVFPNVQCNQCDEEHALAGDICQTCAEFHSTQCQECDESQCLICKDNYFLNDQNLCSECSQSIPNCTTCSQDGETCNSCENGFYLEDNQCVQCLETCEICNSAQECLKCVETYFLQDGECNECSESQTGCKNCSNDQTCEICEDGFYLNDGETCTICSSIHAQCNTCEYSQTDGEICTECAEKYFVDNKSCTACSTLENCLDCQLNQQNNPVCTSCNEETYLSDGECTLCTNFDTNCQKCSDLNNCSECISNEYFLQIENEAGECVSCSQVINNCIKCEKDGEMNAICLECDTFNAVNDQKKCSTCAIVYNDEKCTECDETACQKCEIQHYLNSEKTCTKCSETISNCTDCNFQNDGEDGENSNLLCSSCADGFILKNNQCVPCSEEYDPQCVLCNENQCTVCTENTYFLADDKTCKICSEKINGCEKCTADGNTCNDCIKGNYLESNQCKTCDGENCIDCTAADVCIECSDNLVPGNGGNCYHCGDLIQNCSFCKDDQICEECIEGYYLDGEIDGEHDQQCDPCDGQNCKDCTEPNKCTVCIENYMLDSTQNCDLCENIITDCLDCQDYSTCNQCKSGYFFNSNDIKCQQCNFGENCTECNQNNCIECAQGYYLDGENQCIQCTGQNCDACTDADTCSKCSSEELIAGSNQDCKLCDDWINDCYTCTDYTTCSECAEGYYEHSNGSICNQCPGDDCLACDNAETCTECEKEGQLPGTGGNCKQCATWIPNCDLCKTYKSCETCASAHYKDGEQTCQPCQSHCKICASNQDCSETDLGYFFDLSSKTVKSCLQNCQKCSSQNSCETCAQNHFFLSSDSTCAECPLNCQTCENEKGCSLCSEGYKLSSENLDGSQTCQKEPSTTKWVISAIAVSAVVFVGAVVGAFFWMKSGSDNLSVPENKSRVDSTFLSRQNDTQGALNASNDKKKKYELELNMI